MTSSRLVICYAFRPWSDFNDSPAVYHTGHTNLRKTMYGAARGSHARLGPDELEKEGLGILVRGNREVLGLYF